MKTTFNSSQINEVFKEINTTATPQSQLELLVDELLIEIFNYLNSCELVNIQATKKRFYYLLNGNNWLSNYFWKTVIQKTFWEIKLDNQSPYSTVNFKEEYKKLKTDFIHLLTKEEVINTQNPYLNFIINLTAFKIECSKEDCGLVLYINDQLIKFSSNGYLPSFLRGLVIATKYQQNELYFYLTCVHLNGNYETYKFRQTESIDKTKLIDVVPKEHFRISCLGKKAVLLDLTAEQVINKAKNETALFNATEAFNYSVKINRCLIEFPRESSLSSEYDLTKISIKDTHEKNVFLIQKSYSIDKHFTKQISWMVACLSSTHYLASVDQSLN